VLQVTGLRAHPVDYRFSVILAQAGIQRFNPPDKRSGTLGAYVVVALTSGVL